jgi:hypothetical protein
MRMTLIDRDELRTEAKANDGQIKFSVAHAGKNFTVVPQNKSNGIEVIDA